MSKQITELKLNFSHAHVDKRKHSKEAQEIRNKILNNHVSHEHNKKNKVVQQQQKILRCSQLQVKISVIISLLVLLVINTIVAILWFEY